MLPVLALLLLCCMVSTATAGLTPGLGEFSEPAVSKLLAWDDAAAAAVLGNHLHIVYRRGNSGKLYHTKSTDGLTFSRARSIGPHVKSAFSPALVVVGDAGAQSLLLLFNPRFTFSLSYAVHNESLDSPFSQVVTVPSAGNVGGSMSATYQAAASQLVVVYATNHCTDSSCGYTFGYSITAAVNNTGPLTLDFKQPEPVRNQRSGPASWYPGPSQTHSCSSITGAVVAVLTLRLPASLLASSVAVYDLPVVGQVGLIQQGSGYGDVWNSADPSQSGGSVWTRPFDLPPAQPIGTQRMSTNDGRREPLSPANCWLMLVCAAPCACVANLGQQSGFTAATVRLSCGELVAVFYIGMSGPLTYSLVTPPSSSSSSGSIAYSQPSSVNGTLIVQQPTGVYFKQLVWVYFVDAVTGLAQYVHAQPGCSCECS